MEKIRILQVVPNMQSGGLESLIMNIYRNIDRTKVQFDFLVHYTEKKHYDDEIEALGGKIYRLTLRDNNNYFKYVRDLNKFFKAHPEYKVIHCHMSSIGATLFKVARKYGINVRIAHSHNSSTEKTLKGKVKRILMKGLKKYSTVNFACSVAAGKFLYGNKNFEVIENAIDVENFKFNKKVRDELRSSLNIAKDCFVLGHVGRFNIQKNHIFLLKVFKELRSRANVKLLLIGSGEKEQEIKDFIDQNNLKDDVIILQNRKDIYNWYNVMDCFVLPSLFEGLPLVAVEAQTSGLPCYFSNTITEEVKLTDNVKFLSIENPAEFARCINITAETKDRDKNYEIVKNSNYNIKNTAKILQDKYIDFYNNADNFLSSKN